RPPAPGRIDLYAPMARFLRLHRNDLPTCARVERSAEPAARRRPDAGVWKLLVELCEPKKARLLARQLAKPEGGALEHLIVGGLFDLGGSPLAWRLASFCPAGPSWCWTRSSSRRWPSDRVLNPSAWRGVW